MSENNKKEKRTSFSEIGVKAAMAGLFDRTGFVNGDILLSGNDVTAHKVMMEGVDFDLVYNPLKHLGYKAVLNVLGDVYAAFRVPSAISAVVGLSSRFSYEDMQELWTGVVAAAKEHHVKTLHLDLNPSVNGLYISLTAFGEQKKKVLSSRPEPKSKDLICLGGNVGAAYLGQHVLEREKAAFMNAPEGVSQPDLSKYKYILSQYLSPEIPSNTIDRFLECDIIPTCGDFVTKGLAASVKRISDKTGFGAKIYVDRIPIASETFQMAEEINMDPITCALNGGDDYRLLYTVPLEKFEVFKKEIQTFDIIGHLCKQDVGTVLVTPDGAEIELKSL
ncbi:MAG: thiamine-phosphate kinase [Bacteroidales bacterium]|nr:thiamine-phosphate kinase [Bacteroidales bacterium]